MEKIARPKERKGRTIAAVASVWAWLERSVVVGRRNYEQRCEEARLLGCREGWQGVHFGECNWLGDIGFESLEGERGGRGCENMVQIL